jgi:hypothetical protein
MMSQQASTPLDKSSTSSQMGRPGKLPTRPPVDLSILDDAPTVKYPYDPNDACDDLPAFAWAVYIFTNARMSEAEEYCRRCDPDMYASFRDHIILAFKAY